MRRKDPNSFSEVYKRGVEAGYVITNARVYLDEKEQEQVETVMSTPYVDRNGTAITGYAVVPVTHGMGLRDSNTVEFYSNGHNLDYMEDPADAVLYDKAGNMFSTKDAREEMGRFAAAGSEYPHVMPYEEWLPLRERNSRRLGLDAPTDSDYDNYLDSMERQMLSRSIKFVGRNTTFDDIQSLRENTPGKLDARYNEMDAYYAEHPEETGDYGE